MCSDVEIFMDVDTESTIMDDRAESRAALRGIKGNHWGPTVGEGVRDRDSSAPWLC